MNYWLMKSEPDVFSIDDLAKKKTSLWDGVRNYQARNFMRDQMRKGDQILFYHSNAKPPGVAGLAKVASEAALPDPTQFDKKSEYYDPKSLPEKPTWHCVKVAHVESFKRILPLDELRNEKALRNMLLFKRSRLSVQPVTKAEFLYIVELSKK